MHVFLAEGVSISRPTFFAGSRPINLAHTQAHMKAGENKSMPFGISPFARRSKVQLLYASAARSFPCQLVSRPRF